MDDTPVAPVRIVVVYHNGYGDTARIADAVARGAAAISVGER
jgi:NAD(P)H dehydrogenase (quinone)